MEAIRYIISLFLKIALALFGLAIMWWLVSLLFPTLTLSSIVSDVKGDKKDWLPAPKNYSGLLTKPSLQNEYTNVYVPAAPYNGYNLSGEQYAYASYDYIQYTATGTAVQKGNTGAPAPISKSTYIRNLSIYDGQYIKQGFSFVGEARSEFFRDGRFAVIILNKENAVVGVLPAVATTQWSVPGWVRFQGLINFPLPTSACTMLFEQSVQNGVTRPPIRIPYRLNCLQ